MEDILELTAFGKVNLSLNITGRRDGLHTLDSVMMSVDCYDTVTVAARPDSDVRVEFEPGADIDPVDNTAYRAAKAVADIIGRGVDIRIKKNIPIGAGMGGSSADAAAVLRALDIMYDLPARGVDMRKLALSVGSDVPFMLTGGLARVRGVGEDLFFIENKNKLFAVGLMSESVSTKAAYAEFDALGASAIAAPTDNDKLCELLLDGDNAAVGLFGNALYEPAKRLAPSIERNARILSENNAEAVNMTGSGGMVVGYFCDVERFMQALIGIRDAGVPYRAFKPMPTGILHKRIGV